jgi:hypothetical protein
MEPLSRIGLERPPQFSFGTRKSIVSVFTRVRFDRDERQSSADGFGPGNAQSGCSARKSASRGVRMGARMGCGGRMKEAEATKRRSRPNNKRDEGAD